MKTKNCYSSLRNCVHRLGRYGIAFAASLIAAGVLATTIPASAAELCSGRRHAVGNHTVQKFFFASGWGWTNWVVRAAVWADDDCLQGRGDITVSVTLPQSSVDLKGGQLTTAAYVRYVDATTGAAGNWIPLKLTNQVGRNLQFKAPNGAFISMSRSTRVAWVAINTAAWTKQDGSRWIGLGNGWVYCNLWMTHTAAPGACHGD